MTFKKGEIHHGCLIFHCENYFYFLDEIVDNFGKGNFGIVYKVEGEKKENFFVIKVMVLGKAGNINYTQNIKTMKSELQIGKELGSQCEYLVKTESFFIQKKSCFLIMKYCSSGDLEEQFKKQNKIPKSIHSMIKLNFLSHYYTQCHIFSLKLN
jgi:serine/threonine protein kinase